MIDYMKNKFATVDGFQVVYFVNGSKASGNKSSKINVSTKKMKNDEKISSTDFGVFPIIFM